MSRRPCEPPKVTGISPKEGPPGTKITIRGENLGVSVDDVIGLTICDMDCLMYTEWQSPSKILSRSARCKGMGDVIVVTKSGGIGTCTVQFKGYEEIVGPTKESAVWINEDDYYTVVGARHRATSPSALMYHQDPLGLCTDDESPVTGRSKVSDSLFIELFPEASEGPQNYGNISSENFIPAWYLLENHNSSSFADLKRGLMSLRQKVNGQSNPTINSGPVTFLKSNVLPVIECLDALKALHLTLKKDKQECGPDLTAKIEDSIKKSMSEAHEVFDSILARKDNVDSTRNALNVLQRYRFLFNLPSNIERSIQKKEYDVVINDFSRAKSLFCETQVNVFKKVYSEVEVRIERFRNMLQDRLRASCDNQENRNIDELKKLVRYLITLDVPGNPAWESIERIKNNLITMMTQCNERHLNQLKKPVTTIEPDSLNSGDYENENGLMGEAPQSIQFIEELTTHFNQNFADLVKLGEAYLNGDLYTKESEDQLRAKQDVFNNEIIVKPVTYLVTLMRAALLPTTVKNIKTWPSDINDQFVIWLPYCLRSVINCHLNLSKLELQALFNVNVLKLVQQFIFDLRLHSMNCLFDQAAAEVKNLYLKETWEVEMDDSFGARTNLPLLYQGKVIEILQLVRETVLLSDTELFSQINVQGSMKQKSQLLLQSFIPALEKTVTTPTNSPTTTPKAIPGVEDRTLIALCNCSFTSNNVIPKLHESFEMYGYPDVSLVIKVTQARFRDLETKLFSQYVERKGDVVIAAVEPAMNLFENEWYSSNQKPSDVSYFVKETMMNLIEVEAEVYQVAPHLVKKVMSHVIEASLEEIGRQYDNLADRLSEFANLQALIDVRALQIAFDSSYGYQSESTKQIIKSFRTNLKQTRNPTDLDLIDNILTNFKQSMQLQLNCFKCETELTIIAV